MSDGNEKCKDVQNIKADVDLDCFLFLMLKLLRVPCGEEIFGIGDEFSRGGRHSI